MKLFYTPFKKYIFFIIPFFIVTFIYVFISCHSSNRYRVSRQPDYEDYNYRSRSSSDNDKLDSFVSDWLGTPYKYGGLSKRGVDCSGFVYILMLRVYHKQIPRVSRDQYSKGRKIMRSRLQKGDLVFFKGMSRRRGIDHVGIYLGNNSFAHASQKKGVIISSLSDTYYKKRYAGACRY